MPSGRDRVDHPNRAGHHDDLSNVTSGALWRASTASQGLGNISLEVWQRVLDDIDRMPRMV